MTTFKLNQRMNVMINFASPLCYNFLDIDNSAIEQYCYSLKTNSKEWDIPGGWQSSMLDLDATELAPLMKEINLMIDDINDLYKLKREFTFKIQNGWVNINNPGRDQIPNNYYHLHPEQAISFVYYVKAEEDAGNLISMSPNQILEYVMPDRLFDGSNMFNSSRTHIPPTVGKLIAFPSWLMHFAEANNSKTDRISIAFNAKICNRINNG
jgi:uncharacterized protein (TIGR02466 family)